MCITKIITILGNDTLIGCCVVIDTIPGISGFPTVWCSVCVVVLENSNEVNTEYIILYIVSQYQTTVGRALTLFKFWFLSSYQLDKN